MLTSQDWKVCQDLKTTFPRENVVLAVVKARIVIHRNKDYLSKLLKIVDLEALFTKVLSLWIIKPV
jgi:hypothetical protein